MPKEPVKPQKSPAEEPDKPYPVENPPTPQPNEDRPLVDPVPPEKDLPRMQNLSFPKLDTRRGNLFAAHTP